MSLEAALAANTEALNAVAELLRETNAGRVEALAKVTELAGTAPAEERKPRAGRPPKDKAPEETKAKTDAPKVPSVDDLRAAAVKFNGVDGDEKQRRKDFMKAVMDHLGIVENTEGKRVITGAAPEDRQQIIDWFAAVADGKTVNFQADDGDDAGSDEDDIG